MKKIKKWILMYLVIILTGIALGVGMIYLEERLGYEIGLGGFVWLFLFAMISIWLSIVLHEGGHMVCALLSGYRFVSFRIGSLMLIGDEQGFHLKQFSLSGTGGQCLMDPPEMKDGDFSYTLYNLGGALANLITALVCGLICFLGHPGVYPLLFLIILGVLSLYLGLINGIPLQIGGLDNDGRNILSMKKSALARKCLWLQLRTNAELVRGRRLKELPEEWFEEKREGASENEICLPGISEMRDSLTATIGALAVSRLLDAKRLDEAKKLGWEVLDHASGLVSIHRSMLTGEMIFLELLKGQREDILAKYEEKEFQKFLMATKKYPSTVRLQYAYALLWEKDRDRAEKHKAYFEKVIKSYPNVGEISGERELMACVEEKGAQYGV